MKKLKAYLGLTFINNYPVMLETSIKWVMQYGSNAQRAAVIRKTLETMMRVAVESRTTPQPTAVVQPTNSMIN